MYLAERTLTATKRSWAPIPASTSQGFCRTANSTGTAAASQSADGSRAVVSRLPRHSLGQRPASRSGWQTEADDMQFDRQEVHDSRAPNPRASAGSAGLSTMRQGWKPVRGEAPVPRYLGGSARSATARPRPAGRRPGPPGPGIETDIRQVTEPRVTQTYIGRAREPV
jgi:hypothetical protein